MTSSNIIEFATTSVFALAGIAFLATAGMASAVVTGSVIAGGYILATR
ncbi:hypothetical protein [Pseudoalteromonas tunicata]|uniref:Uncharacterized protein n=1 Tax=Pseudoalteromonas tunicata D2 TaxID=87626 RepID=A4CEE0_9GAMM|nr:hypothetical protein [Pseudoalteromonas tunicata]ATC93010.1 hypothetical protein PTUN_a0180 [Pseudoalteromonas tunicata]EAR26952.1 hypothetical protein PTD2_10238 [Pseudoalteromonas tunicata D2]MDP5213669.1 hypothetical protein [Pseudoalteromonas tunicata]MDP5213673.1 hypothetical protein [Pseudoalteromonas tunicata]